MIGVILGETLEFDVHWRSGIAKASGRLNGIGKGHAKGWRQLYMGMIRVVAMWGAEFGWVIKGLGNRDSKPTVPGSPEVLGQ